MKEIARINEMIYHGMGVLTSFIIKISWRKILMRPSNNTDWTIIYCQVQDYSHGSKHLKRFTVKKDDRYVDFR